MTIDWAASEKELEQKLNDLPSIYPDEELLQDYSDLLDALDEPEIQDMPPKSRAFVLHQRFERFALSYSTLFNIAARRDAPVPLQHVKEMLRVAKKQKEEDTNATTREAKEEIDDRARNTVMSMARNGVPLHNDEN
jgi:hypothetical protein